VIGYLCEIGTVVMESAEASTEVGGSSTRVGSWRGAAAS
jgi:hypothetical protein